MTRSVLIVAIVTFACTLIAGCQTMNPGTVAGDADRIRELDERWKAAAERRDLDGMMSIYASDARELLPGMPEIVGIDAIREFYGRLIEAYPRFAHEFEMADILVAASGDLAVVRGTYRFTADTLRPNEVRTGKYVGVWRKTDGDWRLHVNISNADPAPTQ